MRASTALFSLLALSQNAYAVAIAWPEGDVGGLIERRSNFQGTCQSITFDGRTIKANCINSQHQLVSTSLDMNPCIQNLGGNLAVSCILAESEI